MRLHLMIYILFLIFPLLIISAEEKNDEKKDKTLSPYFFVENDSSGIDALPLKKTSANVKILGVIADVTVKQVYVNKGKTPLEAVYVFPASTRAAVYALTMKIGNRLLKAEVQTRKKARETYEKAKNEGRSASLLEQERPNVFQMNVANILPGDTVEVEMKYTELLIPDNAVYEFVFPTVTGPRYSSKKKSDVSDNTDFVETPYLHEGEKASYEFDLNASINAGMPIAELESPSHKINIEYSNNTKSRAVVSLSDEENNPGNKDFVLRYVLSGNKINTGLLLSKGEKENFFLLMLQPPKKVKKENITAREYIFVVDVSGSMNGYPLDISKKMIKNLLNSLNEKDLFNIILFAGSSRFLNCMSMPATSGNISEAMKMINTARGGGGTELIPALKKVFNNPKPSGFSRSIVILTDGYINVEKETFDLIANNLNNTNIFAFGIGTSVNRYLIEGMARVGNGQPFFVLNKDESEYTTQKFINYISTPVLTNVKVEFNGFNAYDVEPRNIADVMEQRPIIIYGKWSGVSQGRIRVSGIMAGNKELHVDIPIAVFAGDKSNDALKYIWARNKIAILSDYNAINRDEKRINEVTELGLKYNLLTEYTSFVAVDYLIRNDGKEMVKVKQALPLPKGVSDNAVGGNIGQGSSALYKSSQVGYMIAPLNPGTSSSYADAMEIEKVNDKRAQVISINFEDVFNYPQKALDKGEQGNVIVWALFKRSKSSLNKCIFVKPVQVASKILYDAVKEALLKTTISNNCVNSNYFWVKIKIEFNAANRTVKIINSNEIKYIYFEPEIDIIKKGKGKKVAKGRRIKINYSIFSGNCEQIEFDRTEELTYDDSDISPAIFLMLGNMSAGDIIRGYIPVLLFNPDEQMDKFKNDAYFIDLKVLEVK